MQYTEEEIKKYLDILHNYGVQRSWDNNTNPPEERQKPKCKNCQRDDCFIIVSGYKLCENCGCQNGHVLG